MEKEDGGAQDAVDQREGAVQAEILNKAVHCRRRCIECMYHVYFNTLEVTKIAPTHCFMLLDGAAIFRETTECRLN